MASQILPPAAVPAINKNNMLEKLCYVAFGGGLAKHQSSFRSSLYEFHQFSGTSIISRQTIQYWFDRNSKPSRQEAFEFLSTYMKDGIKYDVIDAEQKKVFSQLTNFFQGVLRSNTHEKGSDKIYVSTGSRVIINTPNLIDGLAEISDGLLGVYITYRHRLSENSARPIAKEVLRIFRRQKDIVFEHWYTKDASQIDKFEGVVMAVGNVVWFTGAACNPPERLRVLHFKKVGFSDYRWGIMSTDITADYSNEPASCRILLCKFKEKIERFNNFVKETVKNIAISGDDQKEKLILRLIDNNITAISTPRSTQPAKLHDGESIIDVALKVSQVTLQESAQTLDVS